MASKNECGKTRDIEDPYEVWECKLPWGITEYRILKKYQSPKKKQKILSLDGSPQANQKLRLARGNMEICMLEISCLVEGGLNEHMGTRLIISLYFYHLLGYSRCYRRMI